MPKILVIGASGSGTSTIGRLLAQHLNIAHRESDEYFWKKTFLPFTEWHTDDEIAYLLKSDVLTLPDWVMSGDPSGWGDSIIPELTLVVFLWVPINIRVERILKRDREKYGDRVLEGGDMYENHQSFVEWTQLYDKGGVTGRTKQKQEDWMSQLNCPKIRLEGHLDRNYILNKVVEKLKV